MTQIVAVGEGAGARKLTALLRAGREPAVVWLGGLKSDMRSTKAQALDGWAQNNGRSFLRFDYSGHGESEGAFEDGTVSQWLEDTLAVLRHFGVRSPLLVGSSMGAWIALLAAREFLKAGADHVPVGIVLIAPATDFTERLMWDRFPADIKRAVEETGVYRRPSSYSDEPYPITRSLIEDGRRHLLFGAPIATGCPVHVLQGMKDADVPWGHALQLVEHLPGDSVSLTLIKDGDHRLSRPEDIARLIAAIEAML